MPVIIEEVVGTVAADTPAPAARPAHDAPRPAPAPDPRALRHELRRGALRQARLRAD